MSERTNRLIEVLTEEIEKLRRMADILEEEREHICGFKALEIENINLEKETLVGELAIIRKTFRSSLQECCGELGLPESSVLSTLIEKLPEPEKKTLSDLRVSLLSLSAKIEELLSLNSGLLESGLSIINRSMGFFKRVLNKSETYGSSGHMTEASSTSLFCREI